VALGIVGTIWKEMTPSLPPVPPTWNSVEAPVIPIGPPRRAWLVEDRFQLLAGVLFVGMTWIRVAQKSTNDSHRRSAAWLGAFSERVSKKWFELLVGNAFIAMVGGLGLY
jgi:hypothetical protein